MVPRIMKVAEQTEGSKIDFQFYGLARQFSGDAEAKKYGIKSVPTGVIFVDGKEVGRLSGNDWASPETAIRELIGS
jgi:thiol-disulfide isomerase/thioredoxin